MAQMGVGEGKSIGEWFGPNTVAQVLKCRKHFVRKALCKSEVGSTTERELGTLQGSVLETSSSSSSKEVRKTKQPTLHPFPVGWLGK
ncbi:uncharacterized protein LOC128853140 isoform X6 [Cuculus canorus]|uniref:uncharacterized protein LOC128853140 isoform X6 n=1 Tax=Cuculus canorus TaxID=55661 RepID=UPI0023AA3625|nr:uncharacterized protein LOC128853140 isoform X6 [Cuculus canorus]